MRALSTLSVVASLFAAGPAFAQSSANMQGMNHKAAPTKIGQGTGVITAIDAKAHTVTIKHGAIPAVGWPAMTMVFKVTPATLLNGARVGQSVAFGVRTKGMDAEVISLRAR